jgi:hypothetical protein
MLGFEPGMGVIVATIDAVAPAGTLCAVSVAVAAEGRIAGAV